MRVFGLIRGKDTVKRMDPKRSLFLQRDMGRSILWFRQDLRLHDNESLVEAIRNADEVIPVYVFDIDPEKWSFNRIRFLIESVTDLRNQLRDRGSDLLIRHGKAEDIIYQLAIDTRSQWVYCNRERTRDEEVVQDLLEKKLWTIGRELRYSRGKMLYYTSDLPFPVTHCPDSFLSFRKEVEQIIPVRIPLPVPEIIPPLKLDLEPGEIPDLKDFLDTDISNGTVYFKGGETYGLKAIHDTIPVQRPELLAGEGRLLSPWISMGCLSPKKVFHDSFDLKEDGEDVRQNLMYRDYLRLMAKKYGNLIFYKSGITGKDVKFDHNEKAFISWKRGQTGIAIIDAAMHQLNQTGWLPDVLRKLVANYFIKVLKLDWRLGASYFESRLIDYDPCSNWVAWLNIAGLGPDSRDDRIIHYDAVGKKLDPDGSYVNAWIN
jgi:deoxyribodipyrimidine photo-lyase